MELNTQQSNQSMSGRSQQQTSTQATLVGSKKRLPKWAKILIIVVSVGLIAGIGGIIAANAVLKNNDKEVQGFLSSIYSSNYSDAYNYFSSQLKEVQSQDIFESQVATLKTAGVDSTCAAHWTTNSVSSSTDTGNTKELSGTLDCDKGSFNSSFKLVKQDGSYKLYSYSIQPK